MSEKSEWEKNFEVLAQTITGGKGTSAIVEANRLRSIEERVRNIIYNVEHRPEATDVPRLIRSLRSVVGLKEGECP